MEKKIDGTEEKQKPATKEKLSLLFFDEQEVL